jgi:hypothetical protein
MIFSSKSVDVDRAAAALGQLFFQELEELFHLIAPLLQEVPEFLPLAVGNLNPQIGKGTYQHLPQQLRFLVGKLHLNH